MVRANAISAAAAILFLIIVLLGGLSVVWAVGLMCLFTFGVGMASPAAMTKAVSVNPRAVGSAAGLYGFTQMAIGAVCTSLSGLRGRTRRSPRGHHPVGDRNPWPSPHSG